MKKVSELEGALLDYWVAMANGESAEVQTYGSGDEVKRICVIFCREFAPSTSWAQGGPIIERQKIEILHPGGIYEGGEWTAGIGEDRDGDWKFFGQGGTPLIAAMRAYVASKYGETVPDEPA